jgi:agmatinase
VNTSAIFFPFDLFGSGGSAAGATLLADELREILADNREERTQTRARAYTRHVRVKELAFETLDSFQDWREKGRKAARQALRKGDFLLWVAGNHLGALPVYDELSALGVADLERPTLVVQFDAHLDIHRFGGCLRQPSHGNFLLHCDGPLPAVINIGHRELLLPDDQIQAVYKATFPAAGVALDPAPALAYVACEAAAAGRVFLDLDCDVFDPAYFPAVGQPVPFGLAPPQILPFVEAAWAGNVAGVLVSEFDPGRDANDRSLAALVWLIEYLLLRRYE